MSSEVGDMAFYYRGPQSPRDEAPGQNYSNQNPLSPQRNPNRLSGGMVTTAQDVRGGMTRRFTTNALPTLSPIAQQRKQAAGDYTPSGYGRKVPQTDFAVRQYEALLSKQREIQAQLDSFDPETRRDVEEGRRHEDSISQMLASSEPASPPDYSNAFPTAFSKPNRYSMNSLTSPPGIVNRPSRSSTQLTSPGGGYVRPYTSGSTHLPSQSVPGSRRHSDDEDEDDSFMHGFDSAFHRSAANPNRNSMPITGYGRKRNTVDLSLDPVNTTSFLFDDDEDRHLTQSKSTTTSPPNHRLSLQVQQTADGFPKLIRADTGLSDLSSSAALDLALAQGVDPQQQVADRSTANRHRISLPPSALSSNGNIAPLNSILANADNKSAAINRRSLEVKFSAETKRPSLMASPPRGMANAGNTKSGPSYSTNDLPTLRSINSESQSLNGISAASPSNQNNTVVEPASPDHSADASRTTSVSNALNHQGQDFTSLHTNEGSNGDTFTAHSGLQASAPSFGPMSNGQDNNANGMQNFAQNGMSPYAQQAYFGGAYNIPPMHLLNNGFGNMNINGGAYGGQPPWSNQPALYGGQQAAYNGYSQYSGQGQAVAGAGRYGNDQRANMQQRRQAQEEAIAKYNSINIEDIVGEIYGLCKDQHGCRFLQRKLDDRNAHVIQIIFDEVKNHIIELMTDPFGNYLCQKLLECTNDDQRTVLIQNSMSAMTKIALNQHGTRALQKMIEFISTPEQIQLIIEALRFDVVQLIQDLNGNHVIQKCLNHLSAKDAQFIFDAVGTNCIAVGTHRHGCCVLQRCIDHASGVQKGNLVDQVIANAFALVQDAFGNYVVQYILDLNEPCFTEPLCESFYGHIPLLSKQKFSSNVIEKCMRCATEKTRREMVHEILQPREIEKLLRDSFANYVVQTAMDSSDEESKKLLIDNIRPILPTIRSTPYGRRIQSKINEYDARMSATNSKASSGLVTPAEGIYMPMMSLPEGSTGVEGMPGTNGTMLHQNGTERIMAQPNGSHHMMNNQIGNGSVPNLANGHSMMSPPSSNSTVMPPANGQSHIMSPQSTSGSERTQASMPQSAQSAPAPTAGMRRQGWAGPPPEWRSGGITGPQAFVHAQANGTNGGNAGIASPTPQRHNASHSWMGGNQSNFRSFRDGPSHFGEGGRF